MEGEDQRPGPSPSVKAGPKRCSAFPGAAMARSFGNAIWLTDGVNRSELITGTLVAQIQPESLCRVLHSGFHQKRGPPMVLQANF